MSSKSFVVLIFFLLFSTVLSAQTIGEKVYKEIVVEGKKESHWLICKEYLEYDVSGNLILKRDDYGEKRYTINVQENKLDRKNDNSYMAEYEDDRIIHEKTSFLEAWYSYDNNGNLIYRKSIHSLYKEITEQWMEYDSNANLIHEKDNKNFEKWYNYDNKGNLIYWKTSDNSECWQEFNEKNLLIHRKNKIDLDGRIGYLEYWYEYDSHGNLTITKDRNGIDSFNEYSYFANGNIKTKTYYSSL